MRAVSSILAITLLTVGIAAPAAAAETDPVRLDVGFGAGTDTAALVSTLGDSVVDSHPVPGLNAIAVDVLADRADADLAILGAIDGVRYAERGGVVGADSEISPGDNPILQIPGAWTWTTGSPDVTVAVVDTGVTPTADLGAARLAPGYDFVDGDTDPADSDGHGTLVAGLIGAQRGNDIGTAGICSDCTIMPVRVMDDRQGTTADVAAGIVWAADHHAQVINVSLSTASPSDLLQDAVEHADAKDSLVLASAGNDASTARRYPAAFESVLAVAQLGIDKNTATDQWVDLGAYSGVALGRDGKIAPLTGASGATAMASGVAALAFSMKPSASADEVRTAIKRDADLHLALYPNQAPGINAAHLMYDFGGDDTVAPVFTQVGVTANELIPVQGVPAVSLATDDHAVQRIDYSINGQVVASARPPAQGITLRAPAGLNGPLPVTVAVYDYAGNVTSTTVTVQADSVKPTASFVSPVRNAVVHGPLVDVTVAVPDTDVDNIFSIFTTTGSTNFLTKVPGTNLWKGRVAIDPVLQQLYLAITDKAGNRTDLKETLQVDNDPPAGGTITPASGTKVRGTFYSTLSGVTDASGLVKTELWYNGKYVAADTVAPHTMAVNTGTYNGTVTLLWKVTDRWGLSRTLPARTLIADNKPPTLISSGPGNNAKVKGTATITVKASDVSGIARLQLIVNGGVVATDTTSPYVLSVNTAKVAKTMKVQIRAYDKLGNVITTSARTWYRA